jgi:hypothetical protein
MVENANDATQESGSDSIAGATSSADENDAGCAAVLHTITINLKSVKSEELVTVIKAFVHSVPRLRTAPAVVRTSSLETLTYVSAAGSADIASSNSHGSVGGHRHKSSANRSTKDDHPILKVTLRDCLVLCGVGVLLYSAYFVGYTVGAMPRRA